MAVDTRNKRASVIGVMLPVPSLLPNPDSEIDQQDRTHVAYSYALLSTVKIDVALTDSAVYTVTLSDTTRD